MTPNSLGGGSLLTLSLIMIGGCDRALNEALQGLIRPGDTPAPQEQEDHSSESSTQAI